MRTVETNLTKLLKKSLLHIINILILAKVPGVAIGILVTLFQKKSNLN